MNIAQAKSIDLERFVARLGFEKVKKGNSNEAWYKSPFRKEKTASFKINLPTQRWIDFGEGRKTGDIIDLVKAVGSAQGWGSLDTKEALKKIGEIYGEPIKINRSQLRESSKSSTPQKASFRVDKVEPLQSRMLIDFMRDRKLRINNIKDYVQQVRYTHIPTGGKYTALTWANEKGGQEVRSPKFKAVFGPKAITTLEVKQSNTKPGTAIFEGMTDYLSYLQLAKKEVMNKAIVMNSAAMYDEVIKKVKQLPADEPVQAFLQNDKPGLKAAAKLKEGLPRIEIQNGQYKGFKDLNDYLVGKPLSMEQRKEVQEALKAIVGDNDNKNKQSAGRRNSMS